MLCALTAGAGTAAAQVSAQGTIEGIVRDGTGALVPGAEVIVTNTETGIRRAVVTNHVGIFRVPLLNPGESYLVAVELAGFRRYEQPGIALRAGQVISLNISMQLGQIQEVVTVSGDVGVVKTDTADIGRTISTREIANLPLVSRNPYNIGLLTAGVVGRENEEFGVPRFSANGFKSRVDYRLDGNTNTQKDRPGLRLQPISEVFIQEVQMANNGFNAEFGGTTGVVYNAVTKAGTNDFHGEGSYRFRRTDFSAFPFNRVPGAPKAPTSVDNFTAALGGPAIQDRWHFFTGYEYLNRDLSGQRAITVTPATATALGLDPGKVIGNGFQDATQKVNFFIVRSDFQVTSNHKMVNRYNLFRNNSPNNVGGGLNTKEVSIDFGDASDAFANQLISFLRPNLLNEFRFQFSRRLQDRQTNSQTGSGPEIVVTGIATFGGVTSAPQEFSQKIWQVIDHMTYNRGSHSIKFGVDIQRINDGRFTPPAWRYTFPTIQAYLDATSGKNRLSYTSFQDQAGNPEIDYNSTYYAFFVQDEWKVLPNLRFNYGIRWDLYDKPGAHPQAALETSRSFNRDTNNIAPRAGLAWGIGPERRTVLRASYGVFFDSPAINHWADAIQNNGTQNVLRSVTVGPTSSFAPAFPGRLTSVPPITQIDILTVDPNFADMYAHQANLQLERQLARDLAVTAGYIFTKGTRIPVRRNINVVATGARLADGRPIFGSGRVDSRFNNIRSVESVGNSNYNAGFLQINKRFSRGFQATLSYTYAHGIDDAPEVNVLDGEGEISDPSNRGRDRGNSQSDLRHNLTFSTIFAPKVDAQSEFLRTLLNNNQVSFVGRFTSGEYFSILGNRNTNGLTGTIADRPLFIGRNTQKLPGWKQIDMRYSRYIPLREGFRAEIFGEFTNLFNMKSIISQNGTVSVNTDGSLVSSLPSTFPNTNFIESRQFQMGFKVHF